MMTLIIIYSQIYLHAQHILSMFIRIESLVPPNHQLGNCAYLLTTSANRRSNVQYVFPSVESSPHHSPFQPYYVRTVWHGSSSRLCGRYTIYFLASFFFKIHIFAIQCVCVCVCVCVCCCVWIKSKLSNNKTAYRLCTEDDQNESKQLLCVQIHCAEFSSRGIT